MPKNTTTTATPVVPDEVTTAIGQALAEHPEGATVRKLATTTGLSQRVVTEALGVLASRNTATRTTRTDGNRKTELWTPVTPAPSTPDTDDGGTAPNTSTDAVTEPATTASSDPVPDTPVSAPPVAAPVSGPPVSGSPAPAGSPVGSADHMKVAMVAGILGDHPGGVTAAAIVDESGLRAAIVGRVLAAMEIAHAATRTTDPESGDELWARAEGDLTAVDLANVATWRVCPTCGHRARVRNGVAIRRTGPAGPGQNSDGQPTLGKNELRTMVRDFLTAHPGHEFTAGTIAREMDRSSGAIGNALAKLVISGEATLVKEAPMTYSAVTADAQ